MIRSTPHPAAIVCAAAIALTGGRAYAAPDDDNAAASIDARADAILQSMGKHYRKADAGGGSIEVSISVKQMDQDMSFDIASEFAFQRPNRIAVRTMTDMYGGNLVNDGEHLYLHAPMLGKYIQADAPASLGSLADHLAEIASINASGGAEFDVLIGLLSDDPYAKLTESISALQYVDEETIGDRAVHRLRMTEEDVDLDLWVGAGDEPWLYRVQPDLAGFFAKIYGEEAAAQAPELIIDFADWTTDAPAADAFAFSTPTDAQKVATFFDPAEFADMGDDEAMKLVGEPAPAFELELLGGDTLNLAAHLGKDIILLDFWATWCGPCMKAIPQIIEIAEAYADKGVVFFGVDVGEEDDKVRALMEQKEWSFKVAMDRDGEVSNLYKAMAIPQTVIIGADGTIQALHIGLLPNLKDQLTAELDTLLSGKSLIGEKSEHDNEGQREGEHDEHDGGHK